MCYSSEFMLVFSFLFALKTHVVLGQPRIVGGKICNITMYPSVVAVLSKNFCGGTILNSYWVLTAAHCIEKDYIVNNRTLVRAGYNYPDQKLVQVRSAVKGIPYPKYQEELTRSLSPEIRFDIGLLKVNRPFDQSVVLRFARLPPPRFTEKCTVATAYGIGSTVKQYYRPQFRVKMPLRCVNLSLVGAEGCRGTWNTSVIDDSVVCTLDYNGKDACEGDSGGPLVCKGVIIGVISMGKGCGMPGFAAVFTKVESYLGFIKKEMSAKEAKNKNKKDKQQESSCEGNGKSFVIVNMWVFVVVRLV